MNSIVVLTGAGISAESGIETFRGNNGLWENHAIENVATPEAFAREPALVHRFYSMRRKQLLSASIQPNAAHHALVRLEREIDGSLLLVTQNVDDLHERAGSQSLIHMHGELLKSRCLACGDIRKCSTELAIVDHCVACDASGSLRPHVVWFGEVPLQMDVIVNAIATCDLFVSVGTSGNVYPAAGFASMAADAGAKTLELNLEKSNTPGNFDEVRYGVATTLVPELVDELLL